MTLPPRPKRDTAARTVRMHPGGQGWVHDDPADVCSVHLHQLYETAVGCEHNSRAIHWKRQKARAVESR